MNFYLICANIHIYKRLVNQVFMHVFHISIIITTDIYNRIRPTGSNPGRIYGLPKLHRNDIPLRPIISGIGSYSHN